MGDLKDGKQSAIDFLMYGYFGDWVSDPLYAAILRAYRDATMRAAFVLPSAINKTNRENVRFELEVCAVDLLYTMIKKSIGGFEKGSYQIKYQIKTENFVNKGILKAEKEILESIKGTQLYPNKDYDVWHGDLCKNLVDFYESVYKKLPKDDSDMDKRYFTYGNAQKLVNMTMKYLYFMSYILGCKSNAWCGEIQAIAGSMHIPLDSYIFKKMKSKYNVDPLSDPWSKITEPEEYEEYQKQLKSKRGNDKNPIDWENALWIEQSLKEKKDSFSLKKYYESN